ncbi:MAG: hypothetical protein ACYDHM_16865 [Acidiferrobacterales bacterium]
MDRYHDFFCCGKTSHRLTHRVVIPALLLTVTAAWSMPTHAALVDPNVTFVENAIAAVPVLTDAYGTLSVTSVSPCSGASCQNTAENPLVTSSSSSSGAGGVGSAQSSADLSTGMLRATAQEDGSASAAAGAVVWDTLTFSGVTGINSTATLRFDVPGTFTDVGFGGACEGYRIGFSSVSTCGSASGSNPFGSGGTVLNTVNPSEILSLAIPLANNNPTEIAVALGAAANSSANIATANLYDPPQLSLSLPSGVSYTSASGQFLTSPAPVPLPPSLPLLASGVLGLWFILRRAPRSVNPNGTRPS